MVNKGFGKLILFGEHFVVYGLPGIACGIELYSSCKLLPNKEGIILDDRPTGKIVKVGENPSEQLDQVMQVILKETWLQKKNFKLQIGGPIPVFGGLGSSAAMIVSIVRELNQKFNLNFDDEKINEIAFKGEQVFHGTPSGIDNTVSTFGGLVWFEKNLQGGKNKIEKLKPKKSLLVVIGNTKIMRDTGKVVKDVRERKEQNQKKFEQIFGQAKDLVHEAKKELIAGSEKKVGELLTKNQGLLKQIGVSSKELDLLCSTALDAGALGAKLTGAGMGGCMFALAKNAEQQKKIAREFEKEGFDSYITKVGV